MPVSKAQQKAVSKYMKENYDVYQIRMPKGRKDEIKAHAEAQGQSVNGFINAAIDEKMGTPHKGPSEARQGPLVGEVVSLHPEALRTAQEAAQSAGETVPQFVERAVTTQAKRDEVARKMEGAHGD